MPRDRTTLPGLLIRFLASTRLALVLILAGLVSAGFSTMIPQGLPPAEYPLRYGALAGRVLLAIGMDRFFSSVPFILLSSLFAVNLSACTVMRIRRRARAGISPVSGPDLIHIGFLLLLAAGLVSAAFREEALFFLAEGEHVLLPDRFQVTLERFDTDRYPDGRVRAWISTLRIARQGESGRVRRVMVNRPASAGSIRLYQSSFRRLPAVRLRSGPGAEPAELLPGDEMRDAGSTVHFLGIDQAGIDLPRPPSYSGGDLPLRFLLRDGTGERVLVLHPGDRIGGFRIDGVLIREMSGILAVRDPGAFPALIAALLILTGLAATLIEKLRQPGRREET